MKETEQRPSHGRNHKSSSSISCPGNSTHQSLPVFQISNQSALASCTYIVQVPRDQVYRLPPPENANVVQQRRRDHRGHGHGNSSCCGACSFCSLTLVLVIVLIGAIVGSVVAIFLIYDNPGFSIEHFLVKRPSLECDIKIKVRNPNKYHTISYDQEDSEVTLSLKQKKFAAGRFPSFDQGSKNSTVVKISMHGSSSQLPREIARRMNSTHSKPQISLSLSMTVPLKFKVGTLNVKSKKIDVSCSFLVDRFDKEAHVLTQDCTNGG